MTDLMTTISDERLAEIDELVSKLNHLVSLDRPENGGPYQGLAARECLSAMQQAADAIQSLRAQGGVRVEEDGDTERHIDELRLRAFRTNSPADMATYHAACSIWFQDRHYRRMALSSLEASPVEHGGVDVASVIATTVCGLETLIEWSNGRSTDAQWDNLHGAIQEIVTAALAAKGGQ